ncbi:MAG TPA: hypothetical protein VMV05_06765 [bacterium]|nr:hypothetical protein [bacterium]
MTNTIELQSAVLFDDKSAVMAFIKNGWLEKVADGKTKDESFCRYTPKGMEFKRVISRFEAN